MAVWKRPPEFASYLELRSEVDRLFDEVQTRHPDLVQCRAGCDDCCYALFQLTYVEAAYIHEAFQRTLQRRERRPLLRKAEKAEEQWTKLVSESAASREAGGAVLNPGRIRIECPLHVEGRCILYAERPATCRVYGIPTVVGGKGVTCGKSGFLPGASYPTVNLDRIQQKLFVFSREMVLNIGNPAWGGRTVTMARTLLGRFGAGFSETPID